MMDVPPNIVDESDRVVLRGELATDVIHGLFFANDVQQWPEFKALFELAGTHLGDSEESWEQGVTWTALIRRKRDRKLFGFRYWEPVCAHHDDAEVESNGDDHGVQTEYTGDGEAIGGDAYVFFPVRKFEITGYEVVSP
jgi:hypothetical protein